MGVFAHDFAGVNLLNITAIEDAVPATTGSVNRHADHDALPT